MGEGQSALTVAYFLTAKLPFGLLDAEDATRWGGVFVMSFVPINYRVQQFISAMSGSVLVAVLAPLAITGDNGARLALLTAAVVMLAVRKPLPAIAAGIAMAAVFRQFQVAL